LIVGAPRTFEAIKRTVLRKKSIQASAHDRSNADG
jgi:hypothetical protein